MDKSDATRALEHAATGDAAAADLLMPLVYDQLRALAAKYVHRERAVLTLQPTALVHEAYLRLVEIDRIDWQGRTHFFAMAARQMRRILIEHARGRAAQKRGARPIQVTLADDVLVADRAPLDLLALDEALERLAGLSLRQAQVAELRLFAGLEVKEIAGALNVSERTVKGDWRIGRAWLKAQLRPGANASTDA